MRRLVRNISISDIITDSSHQLAVAATAAHQSTRRLLVRTVHDILVHADGESFGQIARLLESIRVPGDL